MCLSLENLLNAITMKFSRARRQHHHHHHHHHHYHHKIIYIAPVTKRAQAHNNLFIIRHTLNKTDDKLNIYDEFEFQAAGPACENAHFPNLVV